MCATESMAIKLKYYPLVAIQMLLNPYKKDDPKIIAVREALGVSPDQIMILTVGRRCCIKRGTGGDAGTCSH